MRWLPCIQLVVVTRCAAYMLYERLHFAFSKIVTSVCREKNFHWGKTNGRGLWWKRKFICATGGTASPNRLDAAFPFNFLLQEADFTSLAFSRFFNHIMHRYCICRRLISPAWASWQWPCVQLLPHPPQPRCKPARRRAQPGAHFTIIGFGKVGNIYVGIILYWAQRIIYCGGR